MENREYALTVDKAQKTGIATNNALILLMVYYKHRDQMVTLNYQLLDQEQQ